MTATAQTLLVALQGVPLDAHNGVLRLLGAPGQLAAAAVRQPRGGPPHLPTGTEKVVRLHAAQLIDIAAEQGATDLVFTSLQVLRTRRQ
jgi:hypothetical protein